MTFDPTTIAAQEQVARFLSDDRHFSKTKMTVKHQAFSPPSHLRLSIYRISSDSPPELIRDEEIWSIARDHVEKNRGATLARADISVLEISREGIRVEPAPSPHPRHADVVGWPSEKEKQKEIAKNLAAKATLVLRPTAST